MLALRMKTEMDVANAWLAEKLGIGRTPCQQTRRAREVVEVEVKGYEPTP